MASNEVGLSRTLSEGDYIILSTGAIGTVIGTYPAGYSGPVSLSIDGEPMSELAETLTLTNPDVHLRTQETSAAVFEHSDNSSGTGVRESGRRMED